MEHFPFSLPNGRGSHELSAESHENSAAALLDRFERAENKAEEIFLIDRLSALNLADFAPATFEKLATSRKGIFERIVSTVAIRETPSPEIDRLLLGILENGSGEEIAEWYIAEYFSDRPPAEARHKAQLEKRGVSFLRSERVRSWANGLALARRGRYEKLNDAMVAALTNERRNLGLRSGILSNLDSIIPDRAEELLLRFMEHESGVLRESALRAAVKNGFRIPEALQEGLLHDADPWVNLYARRFLAGEPIDPLPVVPPEGLSRLRGAVLGHAIGDMAGQPVEILKLKEIKSQYGEIDGLVTYRHQTLPTGEYTDDTDMIWMELELMQDGRLDPWRLSEAFARRVSQIDLGQDLPRHYGQGTLMSMRRLGLGVNWRNTGNDSPKNGAAIRALPIAWSEFGDREKLLQMTESLSSLTHTGERALAGAKLVVLVMDYLLRKGRLDSDGLLSEISASIHEPRVSASLDVVKELIRYEASPEEAQARLGTSSKCEESVAYALYCFLRFPDDFRAVMRAAINVDGDSDSIAAVAGSFSGALLGEDAIPAEWKNRLSLKEEINQVLNSLAGHQG